MGNFTKLNLKTFFSERKTIIIICVALIAAIIAATAIFSGGNKDKFDADYSLIPVKQNGKWGFINAKGKMVIDAIYDNAELFTDGMAIVSKATAFDTARGWDKDDYELIPREYKYGFINKKGNLVVKCQYDQVTYFNDGLAFVVEKGKAPVCIDKKGNVKFTLNQAVAASMFSNGLAVFKTKDGKCGYVDKKGDVVIAPSFESADNFSEGLAAVGNKDGKVGYINKKGELVINYQFDNAGQFHEGLTWFCNDSKYGYINRKGDIVINAQFDDAADFSEGLAAIEQGDQWGYIDKKGKMIINPQFKDGARDFSEGMVCVASELEKNGFVDTKGKFVINGQFVNAYDFHDGNAIVWSGSKMGIINTKGKYVVNPQFESFCASLSDSYRQVKTNILSEDDYESDDLDDEYLEKEKELEEEYLEKEKELEKEAMETEKELEEEMNDDWY